MNEKIFKNLKGIQQEMMHILGQVSSLTNHPLTIEETLDETWHPRCDVFETPEEFRIIVELPGMDKSEIVLNTTNDYIRISGVRNVLTPQCSICYHNMEIETGAFERKIFFPPLAIDKDEPKVTYENGFLFIVYRIKPTVERIIKID